MTLAEFLRARLDEDEATALREQEMRAAYEPDDGVVGAVVVFPFDETGSPGDPARVLAEVEAKRRIVAEHHPVDPCDVPDASMQSEPCPTLRLLALPHDQHSDYREEWRP